MKLYTCLLSVFTVIILLSCERIPEQNREEAYKFAQAHYSVAKFTDFYDTLKAFVANHYSNDSIGQLQADTFIVQDIYWGNNVSHYKDSLSQNELNTMYEDNVHIQGWDDCEPLLADSGYLLNANGYYSDYQYYDGVYYDDSLQIKPFLSRYDNGQAVENRIMGYSPNQLQFIAMLWK